MQLDGLSDTETHHNRSRPMMGAQPIPRSAPIVAATSSTHAVEKVLLFARWEQIGQVKWVSLTAFLIGETAKFEN